MVSCPNCGAPQADGAHYCTNCGAPIIGQPPVPAAPMAPPTMPYGQALYGPVPSPGQPYGQAPYGQVPYGQAPYGQVPYGMMPPAAPKRSKTPIIVAGIVALVLVAGGATAFVLVTKQKPLATCLIGSWRVTSYVLNLDNDGDKSTTTVTGLRMQFKTDGTNQQYFTGVTTRTSDGDVTRLSGTVTYTYKVDGDTISYTNGQGQNMSEEGWDIDYTETGDCSRDDLTLKGRLESGGNFVSTWTTELTRE